MMFEFSISNKISDEKIIRKGIESFIENRVLLKGMSLWKIGTKISQILKHLPNTPGIYLFRDGKEHVLYVGRATSLKSRVSSYFQGRDSRGERISQMIDRVRSVETIETETVLESVILESNLIKRFQPKYNVDLKDDKSFCFFAITKEPFPRICIVRESEMFPREMREKREYRGGEYQRFYGPYTSKRHMEIVLKILRRIFPFHSSSEKSEKGCLYFQMGLCPGPYEGIISQGLYRKNIRNIEYVLRGKKKRLLSILEKEMAQLSRDEKFERAKIVRDQVFALRHIRDIALLTNDRLLEMRGANKKQNLIRVEAYDISNISGKYAVGSMAVFEGGRPDKEQYRRFKIRSMEDRNDIAMMREMLARRMRHSEWKTPAMILLDGGKGHLSMAVSLWEALGISIPLAAVAKGPTRKKVDVYTDFRFTPDPSLTSDAMFLEFAREEAHRFAISYHRKVRSKKFLHLV